MLEKILNTEHKENARKTLVISPHADDEVLGCGAMKTEKILEENHDAMLNPANIQIGPNGETKMNL